MLNATPPVELAPTPSLDPVDPPGVSWGSEMDEEGRRGEVEIGGRVGINPGGIR